MLRLVLAHLDQPIAHGGRHPIQEEVDLAVFGEALRVEGVLEVLEREREVEHVDVGDGCCARLRERGGERAEDGERGEEEGEEVHLCFM